MPLKSVPKSNCTPLIRITDTPTVSKNVFMIHCSCVRTRNGWNTAFSKMTPKMAPISVAPMIPRKGAAAANIGEGF